MSGKSMKIAYVIARGDAFGGASLHVCDMARRLVDDGHEARVFVGGTPEMEVPKRLTDNGIEFTCIPAMGRELSARRDTSAMLSLRRKIKEFKPNLVSSHASKAGALTRLACLGSGVPVIYTPHCWSFSDGFPKAGLYLWIERILSPLATRIVTVCEQERQFGLVRSVGTSRNTICIHNGVRDVEGYPAAQEDTAESAPTKILMVARFEEQKDHQLLLKSLSDNQGSNWHLTMVGDGPEKDSCEKLANELGIAPRVDFVGYSDNVADYLAKADLFALVTHWEGFPRSILEAMRASLPVVVSDVGGCSESVLDGVNGRVVPHGDRKALAEALEQLITEHGTRREMTAESRRLYEERFTFEIMYKRYLELYKELCIT